MSDNIQFYDYSVQVKSAIQDRIISFLHEIGGEIRSITQRNSRRDFSQTAGSYQYVVDDNGLAVHIGSDYENAIWEEFGTGIHSINGQGANYDWYVPVDGYRGTKKPTYNGKVVIVHGKNGMKYYKTNGKSANRPLFKAMESTKPKIQRVAENYFKGM